MHTHTYIHIHAHTHYITLCHPTSPSGGHTVLDIDSVPTLRELDELVIGRVAHMEDSLPLHLGVESYVTAAATKNHPNNSEGALREVLDRWLKGACGTGGEDRTWRSVLRALEKSGTGELVEQLLIERFGT